MSGSAPTSVSARPAMPLRLRALVAVVIALGAVTFVAGVVQVAVAQDLPAWWRIALVAAFILVGDLTVLHLRFGSDHISFTWSEAAVLLGLVLVPWPWVSLIAAPCVAIAHLVRRRSLIKVAFNAASIAAGATLARLVAASVVDFDELDVLSPKTWLALSAATCIYFIWNTGTVAMAVAYSQGVGVWSVVHGGFGLKSVSLAGNTVAALVLVTIDWRSRSAALVPAFVILLYVSYRAYLRAVEERDIWQKLDASSSELTRLDELEVVTVALRHAEALFKTEYVELSLIRGGQQRVYRRRDDKTEVIDEPAQNADEPSDVASTGPDAVSSGRSDRIVASFTGHDQVQGTLTLGFRAGVQLTGREQQVLRNFMHTVGATLQNVRLYASLRDQAEVSAHEAAHDGLTGLANRSRLRDQMRVARNAAAGGGGRCALLLIDLDHFKEINDTLGHTAGDALLCEIADRLASAGRASDTVARLGGDEFAVLLPHVRTGEDAESIARKLLAVIAEPVRFEQLRLTVEASIGVALYPDDAENIEELLQRADVAMYQAKSSRAAVQRYRSDKDDSSVGRLALATELRSAIDAGELIPYFQPKTSLTTGRVVGFETLVRWQHPTRGLLAPGAFVDVAEQSGLVHTFTLHVLERAVEQCAQWQSPDHEITVAVNLSARNLLDRDLPAAVAAILDRHALPSRLLILEITETTMMSELDVVEHTLSELRRLGVQLSVDDFGTGYSSLAFLQRVAVNEIKIDKSFVLRMMSVDNDAAIVRATIDLGRHLGLRVVAEGVESALELDELRQLGCDVAQGFHLGHPAPPDQTRVIVARSRAERAIPTMLVPPQRRPTRPQERLG